MPIVASDTSGLPNRQPNLEIDLVPGGVGTCIYGCNPLSPRPSLLRQVSAAPTVNPILKDHSR